MKNLTCSTFALFALAFQQLIASPITHKHNPRSINLLMCFVSKLKDEKQEKTSRESQTTLEGVFRRIFLSPKQQKIK